MIYNFKLIRKNLKYNKVKDQWEFNGPYPIILINGHKGKHQIWTKRKAIGIIIDLLKYDSEMEDLEPDFQESLNKFIK